MILTSLLKRQFTACRGTALERLYHAADFFQSDKIFTAQNNNTCYNGRQDSKTVSVTKFFEREEVFMKSSLPFDTTKFEELPISVIICKPVLNADGSVCDYRIVFGNEPFACLIGKNNFVGELLSENIYKKKI